MKMVGIVLMGTVLTGCSYAGLISQKGAEASDEVLRDAIWTMCSAVPVGAVKRRINTEELAKAYDVICASKETLPRGT